MAARSRSKSTEEREPDAAPSGSARNAALAALAGKGVVADEAKSNPVVGLPELTGVEHDLGGSVRAVLTAPSHVVPVVEDGRVVRRLFVYRGEVVKATAAWVEARPAYVKL